MQNEIDGPGIQIVDPYGLGLMRAAARPGLLEFYVGIVAMSIYGMQINSAGTDGLIPGPYVDDWLGQFLC
jgi:hypothetical protein